MNVAELRKMLAQYPDKMEIIVDRMSDYDYVREQEWSVVKAVHNESGWLMKSHETMSDENKAKEKEYLHLHGN